MSSEIKYRSPHPAFPSGQPLEVGDRFLIVPGEISLNTGNRLPLRLARGRAFGSGLHETTISCIKALEELGPLENRTVLDVGTGTGILSLAALSLGARRAAALDIDPDAALACKVNAALNGVRDRLKILNGTLDALNPSLVFDIVMANIHGDILLSEASRLAEHTREGGHLILSGLDYADSRPLRIAVAGHGMEAVSVLFLEDYVTQVWHRPPGRNGREP